MKKEDFDTPEISMLFFLEMEAFLNEKILELQVMNIHHIQIYMPQYLKRLYITYLKNRVQFVDILNNGKLNYRGCEVLDNYQNNVIVSFSRIHEANNYKYNFYKYQVLQIP